MLVLCPACHARYNIDDSKIAGRRTRATCKRCQQPFTIEPPEPAWDDATVPDPPADREATYPGVAQPPRGREATLPAAPPAPRPAPAPAAPAAGLKVGVRHAAPPPPPPRPVEPAAPDRVSLPPQSAPALRVATRVAPPAPPAHDARIAGPMPDPRAEAGPAEAPLPSPRRAAPPDPRPRTVLHARPPAEPARGPRFVVHSTGDGEAVDPARAAMLSGAEYHAPPVAPPLPAPTIAPAPAAWAPPPAPTPSRPVAAAPPAAGAPMSVWSAPPAVAPWTPEEASVLAPTLDFSRVGVLTWRARARDGRVYDFTSLRSLRSQLASGRLTPDAALSPDGQDWTRIGDIANLDVFFVETWERLSLARGGAPLVRPDPVLRAAPRVEAPVVDPAILAPAPTHAPAAAPRPAPEPPRAVAEAPRPVRAPDPYVPRVPTGFQRPWYEAPAIVLLMLFAFAGGALTHWIFSSSARPAPTGSTPAAVTVPVGTPGSALPTPTRGDPAIPTYTVGGTRSPTSTGGGGGRAPAPGEPRPAPTAPPDPRTDAIVAATQLQPSVAPGEGAAIEGTENTGPSEFIQVQEIPASQADAVLRKEGLK